MAKHPQIVCVGFHMWLQELLYAFDTFTLGLVLFSHWVNNIQVTKNS